MKIFPVLLDTRPGYLGRSAPGSLLLMPVGLSTLLDHIYQGLGDIRRQKVTVVPAFEPTPVYEQAVRGACKSVDSIVYAQELAGHLSTYEPSDWLLMVDPRCFPTAGLTLDPLFEGLATSPPWVRHLLALESNAAGTRECVEFDAEGRVRRIQRYYDSVTWTFAEGVVCSLVPASCAMMVDVPFTSLPQLRTALASRGVPSNDLPLAGPALDLLDERDLLRLNERVILDLDLPDITPGSALHMGEGAELHPTAQVLGPVVLQDGVKVEAGATIVGPALLAVGAHVGRDAVIAQCLIGPHTSLAAGTTTRHRLVLEGRESHAPSAPAYDPLLGLSHDSVELREEGRARSSYPVWKVALESLVAGLGLLILSPLLLLLAILVKLDSRGPVFYGDKREGRGGRVFRCFKFRTMRVGADAMQRELMQTNQMDGPQFKMDRDPRVTRLGRILRAISFDEFPQLINVALGQMSLVGPRPSPFRENQMCIPWRDARLSVRPGITGLWQVCRHERATGDFHQWIYYDLLYVRHMSLWVDLKIILATIYTLGGKGHVPLSWVIPPTRMQNRG